MLVFFHMLSPPLLYLKLFAVANICKWSRITYLFLLEQVGGAGLADGDVRPMRRSITGALFVAGPSVHTILVCFFRICRVLFLLSFFLKFINGNGSAVVCRLESQKFRLCLLK
jgi:hypothetical protein